VVRLARSRIRPTIPTVSPLAMSNDTVIDRANVLVSQTGRRAPENVLSVR